MSERAVTYIVAVSGGVDSVALIDALAEGRFSELASNYQLPDTNYQLIVAHYDHGIRGDSGEDAKFVEGQAKKYGVQFELGQGKLGADASEAQAREMRYNFLRQCCKKYKGLGIVTAHHQDDLIETAIINLLRGTGWRGLAPMAQAPNNKLQTTNNSQVPNAKCQILRPLLSTTKQELVDYAKKHELTWREDSTNTDQSYLRNYVRHTLLMKANLVDPAFSKKVLELIEDTRRLKGDIEVELGFILQNAKCQMPNSSTTNYQISRYELIMWPSLVANEVIYSALVSLYPDWHPQKVQIDRILHFVKTAKPGKQLQVSKQLLVEVSQAKATFQFIP